jgi:hypothetical protein
MAGTAHFSRMKYHVHRGLREIVAPRQVLTATDWQSISTSFDGKCAFCDQLATQANRGIVADHLVPAKEFGELVLGNALPACQTCNDSRGEVEWHEFVRKSFPGDSAAQILRIERYLAQHSYQASTPEKVLLPDELAEYESLKVEFDKWLARAQTLRATVMARTGSVEELTD